MRKKTSVLLITGGFNNEREVNLKTAANILSVVNKNKYDVLLFDLTRKSLAKLLSFRQSFPHIDVVLLVIAGTFIEDGQIQAILESQGVRYTGSGVAASAAAFDKYITQLVAEGLGLRVPKSVVVKGHFDPSLISGLRYPLIVKPVAEGSSLGVYKIPRKKDLSLLKRAITATKTPQLISEYISGIELTCPVLSGRALPVILVVPPKGRMFDYAAKYTEKKTQEIVPAPITRSLTRLVQTQSESMHRALSCKGLTRSDFIYSPKTRRLFFLEINTLPGLTPASLAPRSAAVEGITLEQLVDTLITDSLS